MKNTTRLLALLLSFAMLICVIPQTVLAQIGEVFVNDADTKNSDALTSSELETTSDYYSTGETDVYAIGEVIEQRTETTKTFRMSDGSFVAADYGKPIHFINDLGEYSDYDNSLVFTEQLSSEDEDFAGYETKESNIHFKLANNTNSSNLLKITKDKYKISLQLVGANKSKGLEIYEPHAKPEGNNINAVTVLNKFSSGAVYKEILPSTDIEYIISGSSIKENIIVKEKSDSYVYIFELKLKGLAPVILDDGSISFNDEASGEAVMSVPAGYMYDDKGNSSSNITYKIEAQNGKKYRLTVTADANWINAEDRAFPITIDPTVEALTTCETVYDTYVSSQNPSSNYYALDKVIPGYYGNTEECHALITTSVLPELPKSSTIVDARLYVYHMATEYGTSVRIAAKEITSAWDSETVTWNTKPSYGSTIFDYVSIDETTIGKFVAFDITNVAQDWYNGTKPYYGIALCPIEGYGNARIYFGSSDYIPQIFPHLIITYRDTKGLESLWTYSSHSVGETDTGYINGFNGNLVFAHYDMSTKGSILPVDVSHVYNGYLSNKDFTGNPSDIFAPITADYSNMKLGKGWKLSVQETIVSRTIDDTDWYVYNDADGTELYFYYSDKQSKWISEDGYSLYITVSGSNLLMTDDYGNTKTFDSAGRLVKIQDAYGNKKNINYTNNQLASISHTPAGTSTATTHITFTYNSDKYLQKISNSFDSSDYITFTYSGVYLTKISPSKGGTVTYAYNSDGTLKSVTNGDTNYAVNYSYLTSDTHKKIAQISESVNGTQGQKLTYTYKSKFFAERNSGKDDVHGNSDDINVVYAFDNFGRSICSYTTNVSFSQIYNAANAQYTDTVLGSKLNNKVQTYGSSGVTSYNFLLNGSFENISDWSTSTSGNASASVVTTNPYRGKKSVKLTSGSTTSSVTYSKTINLPYTGIYTLSAYVKTNNVSGTGASIILNGTKSSIITGTTSSSINDGWQRISVTNNITATGNYTISLKLENAIGDAYFDCVKLERLNTVPSEYNLIENSTFMDSSAWSGSFTKVGNVLRQHVGKIAGNPDTTNRAYQTIRIDLPSTTTFTLSGWACANSVDIIPKDDTNPINNSKRNRTFGMKAIITYSDNQTETHYLNFNPDYTDWQFGSLSIVPKRQSSSLNVSQMSVYFLYDYNANVALFDELALTIEPAQAYSYDSNGNLETITDPTGNKSSLQYATNKVDVEGFDAPNGEDYEYTYDLYHNVTTAKRNCGSVTQTLAYDYDDFGNTTSVSLSATGISETISSSASYTEDGNFLTETIDSLGSVTQYGYNDVTKLIAYVDAANNTHTAYTYDGRNRVKTVHIDYDKDGTADTNEPAIGYLYANNRLSHITSATTDYTLTYDIFGKLLSVKAGGNTLATYTYAANNGKLQKLTCGNGKYETYEYDSLDRLVKVYYNEATDPIYSVEYDANGRIHSIVDNGTKHVYEYDSLNRLIRAWQYTSSGTLKLAVENSYDNLGRPDGSEYVVGNKSLGYEIIYKQDSDLVNGIILPTNGDIFSAVSYSYDSFDRITQKTTNVVGDESSATLYEKYTYKANSSLVETNTISVNGGESTTYSYTYDAMGNILTVKENGTLVLTYGYTTTNQLATVADKKAGYTYFYKTDLSGNITEKYVFNYTTAPPAHLNLMLSSAIDSVTYTYASSGWKDRLTNYDGISITYDAAGNPTKWRNASSITWDGRNLSAYNLNSSVSVENTYNSQGIRTRKRYFDATQNNGYNIDYTLDGSRIISVRRLNLPLAAVAYTLYFIYDESGAVIGFTYGNEYYSYQKNFQGDVLGIVDKNGTVVVKYTYDAWGKLLSTTGSLASTIGAYNPFRYRSYCYDTETGLYYLNSRYYDPEIGRFLSPDSIVGDARTIVGYSAYTYCSNNPVMRYDDGGQFWDTFFDVVSLVASVVEVCANPADPMAWAGLAGDAIDLIPIVTGVGETIRAVNVASDVVDTVDDVIDTVDTVVDTVDIVHDMGKTAHNVGEFSEDAIVSAKKIHGNSLNSPAKNYGYVLRDNDTDEVLKYGESIRGKSRYTRKYYVENNCYMEILVDGTKRDVHNWQHERIIEHVAIYGNKPRLNKSLW